ncbi:hypothetical protein [Alkaliphilus serpentinus]|uniref:Uncharacterized protein n=1 Tax=Alkaliphilus serpentinus TaxID=1482731 RepID=A0A833M937_9FIRM|nr:hypothetical protein [Alkaliphilus serpentinus]KAB3529016.1 hypothetical protein F8153_10185 [Alkaliphilus serpentinus]
MSKVIDLRDYKTTKQREFFINFYHFLNRNLKGRFENLLQKCNHEIINLLVKNDYDPMHISYFQIPIVTFMVTVFIRNSDLAGYFPEIKELDNDTNKRLFRDNMIKLMKTISIEYPLDNTSQTESLKEIDETIDVIYNDILKCIPKKILLV